LYADLAHENISSMTLSVPQIADKKMKDDACNYLVMACDGEPFDIVTSKMETNAFTSWELLREDYEPSTDKALVSMQEKLSQAK
jgi:hypothetical protein